MRFRWLKLRAFIMIAGVFILAAATGISAYYSDPFKNLGDRTAEKMLTMSAAAGFTVKSILLTGRQQIPADELMARLGIRENTPILGIRIAESQQALMELPWVQSVAISRRLPDKIIVDLQERMPIALWQYKKKISLIDAAGVVLPSRNLGAWKHLPLVVGEDAPAHVVEIIQMLNAEPVLAGTLASAVRIGGRRWDFRLKNGLFIKLPEQDMELALRRLAVMEEQGHILNRDIAGIDLRYAERVVVTPSADVPARAGAKAPDEGV